MQPARRHPRPAPGTLAAQLEASIRAAAADGSWMAGTGAIRINAARPVATPGLWASVVPDPVPGQPVPDGPWRGVAFATVNGLRAVAEHGLTSDVARELGVKRMLRDATMLTGYAYDPRSLADVVLAADDVEALIPE